MDIKNKNHKLTANELIVGGVGVGAVGATAALALGAVCPICVFLAPALVGAGVIKKVLKEQGDTNGK